MILRFILLVTLSLFVYSLATGDTHLTYAIIDTPRNPAAARTCINARACLQTSENSARKNRTGTRMVLKWRGREAPDSVRGRVQTYTYREILTELEKPEWQRGSLE